MTEDDQDKLYRIFRDACNEAGNYVSFDTDDLMDYICQYIDDHTMDEEME